MSPRRQDAPTARAGDVHCRAVWVWHLDGCGECLDDECQFEVEAHGLVISCHDVSEGCCHHIGRVGPGGRG